MTYAGQPTRSPGLDLTEPVNLAPLGWGTRRAASLTVCAHASDATDARDLLAVLGLIDVDVEDTTPASTPSQPPAVMGRPDHPSGRLRGRVIA